MHRNFRLYIIHAMTCLTVMSGIHDCRICSLAIDSCRLVIPYNAGVRTGYFGRGSHDVHVDNVHCVGIELELSDCGFRFNEFVSSNNLDTRCNNRSRNAAGVICGGERLYTLVIPNQA